MFACVFSQAIMLFAFIVMPFIAVYYWGWLGDIINADCKHSFIGETGELEGSYRWQYGWSSRF